MKLSLSASAAATSVRYARRRTFAKMESAELLMYAAVIPDRSTARAGVWRARAATGTSASMSKMLDWEKTTTTARYAIVGSLSKFERIHQAQGLDFK